MNNNSWFKKEKPIVTLPGLGGGSASNIYWRPAGGAGVSTSYVDDVFSTFLYTGNGSYPRTITNGIDFSNNDGLVINKSRSNTYGWAVYDTVRGPGAKSLRIDDQGGENNNNVGPYVLIDQFNSDGFRLNQPSSTDVLNDSGLNTASFSFRKAPGFFDVVTWTGNSDTNQTINHSLSSIPGMIIAKRTDSTSNWVVYHRGHNGYLRLNQDVGGVPDSGAWTPVTSTSFKAYDYINVDGASYVAYIFAGGESDAATAKCVDFTPGSNEVLYVTDSVFNAGSDDFTVECWIKLDGSGGSLNQNSCIWCWDNYNNSYEVYILSDGKIGVYGNGQGYLIQSSSGVITPNQWYHVAVTRSSGTARLFIDGNLIGSGSMNSLTANAFYIGCERTNGGSNGSWIDGRVSNLRLIRGQALYTEPFRTPTEPLTTTSQGATASNVKLLCCNSSTATGGTVTPSTISYVGTTTG